MLNMCQISSLIAATEGPEAEFSSFANFEERKRKWNLLMLFPKIVYQKGSFGQIRKNPLFRFCRPNLDIFGLTLLKTLESLRNVNVHVLKLPSEPYMYMTSQSHVVQKQDEDISLI